MRKDFLKKSMDSLTERKKQLLREIQDRLKEESEGLKDEGRDTYDLASDERDREINIILSARERDKLRAIDDVLQRIEDKTYGICDCGYDNCEEEIGMGRLKVLPFTRLCVRCQEETEKESKQLKKAEEDGTYRRLATNDVEDEIT